MSGKKKTSQKPQNITKNAPSKASSKEESIKKITIKEYSTKNYSKPTLQTPKTNKSNEANNKVTKKTNDVKKINAQKSLNTVKTTGSDTSSEDEEQIKKVPIKENSVRGFVKQNQSRTESKLKESISKNNGDKFKLKSLTKSGKKMEIIKNSKLTPKPKPLPRPKVIVLRYVGVLVAKDSWKTQFYDFIQRDFPYFVKRNYDEYEEYFLKMADENAYYASSYQENDLSFVVTTTSVCLADSLPIWAIFCLQHFDIFEDSFINEFPITSKMFSESIIIGMIEGNFRLDISETVVKFLKNRNDESIPIIMLSNFTYYFYEEKFLTILKYTTYGDLSNYFAQFIDPIKEGIDLKSKETYLEFASRYGLDPEDVMFISGNASELKKSARAGLSVVSTIVSNVNAKYKNIVYAEKLGEIEFFN